MKRFAVVLVVASCGKGGSGKGEPNKVEPGKLEPAAAAGGKPEPGFGPDSKGVVVTAKDVLYDGKSIGVLPERLVTDRAALVAMLRGSTARAIAFTYTADAPAEVVLGALRAIADVPPPVRPPVPRGAGEDAPRTGTAMALDDGKMGKRDAPAALGPEIAISAVVDGKPKEICRATIPAPLDPEDERVELSVQVAHDRWTRGISRIHELATLEPQPAALARDLHDQKVSAFFADRNDLELAAVPGATGADLTPVITAACAVGFFALRPLALAEVTAALDGGAPAVPSISIGQPNVQGDLDKAVIRRYIKQNVPKLLACYETQLRAKPDLAGTVQTQFYISPNGTVAAHAASGVAFEVATCVEGVIAAIEFPKPKGGGGVQVNFPFTFRPPGQ